MTVHIDRKNYELLEQLTNQYIQDAFESIILEWRDGEKQYRLLKYIEDNLTWEMKEDAVRYSLRGD